MDNSLIKKLLTEYENKRFNSISEADKKKQDLYKKIPKFEEIDSELNSISINTMKSVLFSSEKEKSKILSELEQKTQNLLEEKRKLLKLNNLPDNYLDPIFDCNFCQDTGYINTENGSVMCNCLKQKIYNIEYNKSNIGNLDKENFDNFDFTVYSENVDKSNYNSDLSPRDNIKKIYEISQNFIDNFDNPEEKNLMFLGPTGLGKTFLSNCIAKSLLDKGKTILYQTAPVMLDTIISARFDKEPDKLNFIDNILNVDLLIIDDLGTETINSMKFTELFTIINTRLLNQNNKITKTIISTNLDLKSIFEIYNERIGSRIAGYYNVCRFFGEDIRLKLKNKNNR